MANFYGSLAGFGGGGSVYVDVSGLTASATTIWKNNTTGTVNYIGFAAFSETKVIMTFEDGDNSAYGTAVVCTVAADGTVTTGTPTVFVSSGRALVDTRPTSMLTTTKAIIAFRDLLDSNKGKAVVLDVSGTTVTPGSVHTWATHTSNDYCNTTPLSSTKVICTWRPYGAGDIEKASAIILSISGSTVSSGTPINVSTVNFSNPYSLSAFSSTKALVTWTEGGTTQCAVLSVSGTTLSVGSKVQISAVSETTHSSDNINSTTAIMSSCPPTAAGTGGVVRIITISGTTPTVQTAFAFQGASDTTTMVGWEPTHVTMLTTTTAIVIYKQREDSWPYLIFGRARLLTISGNTITGTFVDSLRFTPPEATQPLSVHLGCRKLSTTRAAIIWGTEGSVGGVVDYKGRMIVATVD